VFTASLLQRVGEGLSNAQCPVVALRGHDAIQCAVIPWPGHSAPVEVLQILELSRFPDEFAFVRPFIGDFGFPFLVALSVDPLHDFVREMLVGDLRGSGEPNFFGRVVFVSGGRPPCRSGPDVYDNA
jgi:hypothetical protein